MRRVVGLLLVLVALVSCRHASSSLDQAPADVRLFQESAEAGGITWALPQSGVRIACAPLPVVDSSGVTGLEVVSLELGTGLLLRLNREGEAALTSLPPAALSRRLVIIVDGQALGVVRLNRPPTGGGIVFLVEKSDAELPGLVQSVNDRLGGRRKFLRF